MKRLQINLSTSIISIVLLMESKLFKIILRIDHIVKIFNLSFLYRSKRGRERDRERERKKEKKISK